MGVNILARRPYNVYNIFFILERARLLQDCTRDEHDGKSTSTSCHDLAGFDKLDLPELPPRYHGLKLPPDWYVPAAKSKNRKHVATNGLKNFSSLAQTVASNWKVVDADTLIYCKTVAHMIKERHSELTKGGAMKHQHTSAKKKRKKKKKSGTTIKLKPNNSNALTEAVTRSTMSCICPALRSVRTDNIVTLHASGSPKITHVATDIRDESTSLKQQWIDDLISMPVMPVTLADQTEEINLHIHDMQIENIPTTHLPEPGLVTPPARDIPIIDWWNTDDFDSLSLSDLRLLLQE